MSTSKIVEGGPPRFVPGTLLAAPAPPTDNYAASMKFLPFVFKHLRATWVRTASTVVAMALCVFLFCTLRSVLDHFDRFVATRSPRRLVTRSALSIIGSVPLTYGPRVLALPGVKRVAATVMFAGVLPTRKEGKADPSAGFETDWTAVFQNLAVDAEPYFAMSPELVVPPDQFRDFLADLRGCVIGRKLADKFGWRIGDHFFLQSSVTGMRKKSGPFEFVVRGLVDTDLRKYPGTDTSIMFFHFKYLSESMGGWTDTHLFTVEVEDPGRAAEIAAAIDGLFENSSAETFTETESAFASSFMSLVGDLGALVNGIGLAVCFTILLVTANTMSMAVRERRTEIAVLKTLGFRSGQVMGLVVAEALFMSAAGGFLGIGGALLAILAMNRAPEQMVLGIAHLDLRPVVAISGLGVALVLGFAAGFLPAWGAYRARVTEMLRNN
jgi:putative ABC transport system permease protein